MDFRMAACPEIKQADAAGSHQKSGELQLKRKRNSPILTFLWAWKANWPAML